MTEEGDSGAAGPHCDEQQWQVVSSVDLPLASAQLRLVAESSHCVLVSRILLLGCARQDLRLLPGRRPNWPAKAWLGVQGRGQQAGSSSVQVRQVGHALLRTCRRRPGYTQTDTGAAKTRRVVVRMMVPFGKPNCKYLRDGTARCIFGTQQGTAMFGYISGGLSSKPVSYYAGRLCYPVFICMIFRGDCVRPKFSSVPEAILEFRV